MKAVEENREEKLQYFGMRNVVFWTRFPKHITQ
jgi:hypothetical protein